MVKFTSKCKSITHTYIHTNAHSLLYSCTVEHLHINLRSHPLKYHMYIHGLLVTNTFKLTHTYIHICVLMYVRMYIYENIYSNNIIQIMSASRIYVCGECKYLHIYICTYVHTYIHIYRCTYAHLLVMKFCDIRSIWWYAELTS